MTKFYKAIYAGSGKCYNLVAVFQPDVSKNCVKVLVKQLHDAHWAVIIADTDTQTPKVAIEL